MPISEITMYGKEYFKLPRISPSYLELSTSYSGTGFGYELLLVSSWDSLSSRERFRELYTAI